MLPHGHQLRDRHCRCIAELVITAATMALGHVESLVEAALAFSAL
jgi:hypothetical protein